VRGWYRKRGDAKRTRGKYSCVRRKHREGWNGKRHCGPKGGATKMFDAWAVLKMRGKVGKEKKPGIYGKYNRELKKDL